MEHTMKLREIYFNKIKSGEKIYEIRLNDEKRKQIKVGDSLTFLKEPEHSESLSTTVTDLLHFKTFKEMLKALGSYAIGFEDQSEEEVLKVYHKFYSECDEQAYGILAIKVKRI